MTEQELQVLEAQWAAEDAIRREVDTLEAEYARCESLLQTIEAKQPGLYLTDRNVDIENAEDDGHAEGTASYWNVMICSLQTAAITRAEEAGLGFLNDITGESW